MHNSERGHPNDLSNVQHVHGKRNGVVPTSQIIPATTSAPNSKQPPAPVARSAEAPQQDDMRHVRTRPPSPRMSSRSSRNLPASRSTTGRPARPMSISTPPSQASSSQHKLQSKQDTASSVLPVLRWFTGKQTPKSLASSHSRTSSSPQLWTGTPPLQYSDSLGGSTDSPTSSTSHLSALADALHDDPNIVSAHSPQVDLPSRPQAARLPPSLRPWRPPNHLSDLSRTTLPTACVSPTTSVYRTSYTDPFDDPFAQHEHNPDLDIFLSPTPVPLTFPNSPAPAHLQRSPPSLTPSSTRTSIDTLRSIHERSLHTTPPSKTIALPTFTNPFDWFSSDNAFFTPDERSTTTTPAQKARIRERFASPKNPVVFCHGLLGFDTVTLGPAIAPLQVAHWRGVKDALEANGTEVLITRVPATSSPVDRAKVLMEKIDEVYAGRSVHLIGHSMGGLDCRYLTSHLKERKFKVLSITTIATPHRGSTFADHFIATIGRERMPNVLQLLDLLPNGGGDGKAFEFLTIDNMRRFNEDTPDVEGVKYYSWGAVYDPGLIDTWKWSHSVILEKEGPNDGLVSLKSARWGTYLGTLEGVNHLDLVGWINTARYKWAEIMGREIQFKPKTFYLGIADHLARVAEGQDLGAHEQRPENGAGEAVGAGGVKMTVSAEEREEIRQEGERAEMADSLRKGESDARGGKEARGSDKKAREKLSGAVISDTGPARGRTS